MHLAWGGQTLYYTAWYFAGMAELVDAPDSKSGGGDIVSVRVRLSVPLFKLVGVRGSSRAPFLFWWVFRSPWFALVRRRNSYATRVGATRQGGRPGGTVV